MKTHPDTALNDLPGRVPARLPVVAPSRPDGLAQRRNVRLCFRVDRILPRDW